MLLSLWAGALADNFDRRVVMLCAQIFMLVVSVILAIIAWGGVLTPWLLLGFTFLIGCGTALNGPAWQASVGDMVPRSEERRVGEEGVRTCKSRLSPDHLKQKTKMNSKTNHNMI